MRAQKSKTTLWVLTRLLYELGSATQQFMSTESINSFEVDSLNVRVFATEDDMATAAAAEVNEYLCGVIAEQGSAAAILATGNSQIQFLEKLVAIGEVDWSKVTLFHMDEYLGLDGDHTASFRRYMRERVEEKVRPAAFHYICGDAPRAHQGMPPLRGFARRAADRSLLPRRGRERSHRF